MQRRLIAALESVFLWLEQFASRGLAWCDRHYPDPEIDELIAEIDRTHCKLIAEPPGHRDNVVHLPRRRYFGTRRVH